MWRPVVFKCIPSECSRKSLQKPDLSPSGVKQGTNFEAMGVNSLWSSARTVGPLHQLQPPPILKENYHMGLDWTLPISKVSRQRWGLGWDCSCTLTVSPSGTCAIGGCVPAPAQLQFMALLPRRSDSSHMWGRQPTAALGF